MRRVRNGFAFENGGMHTDDQNLFVIGAIEDRDPSTLWQVTSGPPQKIVLQLGFGRMFETVDATALGIYARHDMTDRAILSRGVGCLQDYQHRVPIGGIVELLHLTQLVHLVFQ